MIIFIQLAKWFWALFPALIGIISPTGAYNTTSNLDLQASQLVANSDLLIDSNSDNVPDEFKYITSTDISLNNGIVRFTPTDTYGAFAKGNDYGAIIGNTYYIFASVKSLSNTTRLATYTPLIDLSHTGSGSFELLSYITVKDGTNNGILVMDSGISDWTPIEVDYIGAINLTAVFGDDIPDKQDLDDFILSGNRFYFTDGAYDDNNWFNTGFTGESRDILDILGYFFWLAIPIIGIYWVFRLLLQII
ncbi:MAG: hypothetical protein AB7V16_13625 [Vulcanibacillus sp.]